MRTFIPFKSQHLAAGLLIAASFVVPSIASAQAFTWILPAGAETWTAGTSHTVLWSGGQVGWNVNVEVIDMNTFTNAGVVATSIPNSGQAVWNIPASLPPGSYGLYIEEVGLQTWTYGPTFTIRAGASCTGFCYGVGTAPQTVCGQTAAEADSLARAAATSVIQNSCTSGFFLDMSSLIVDVTQLAVGGYPCPVGYTGAYAYEASAVGCCCPNPVPARGSTWGAIKSRKD